MGFSLQGGDVATPERPFLIAELSANHDKDLDQALRLVDAAADAGWTGFKLQTYTADSLTMDSAHPSMAIDAIWGKSNLYELYRDAAMPMEFHAPLFVHARKRGLIPFTSVYDPRDLPFAEELGCEIYKIASFELTFDDLLIEIARTGKPVILSTGMANLAEVEHALTVLRRAGAADLMLLHCVSAYPTPLEEANLSAMATLRAEFGLPVGFSDHTLGAQASVLAVAMGAVAIEKHITNDTGRVGPDHRFSATPDIMAEIAEGVRTAVAARGTGQKTTQGAESGNKSIGRRSAFAVRDLEEGAVISEADFRFIRPGAGIAANQKATLLGATLSNAVQRGEPITPEDLV